MADLPWPREPPAAVGAGNAVATQGQQGEKQPLHVLCGLEPSVKAFSPPNATCSLHINSHIFWKQAYQDDLKILEIGAIPTTFEGTISYLDTLRFIQFVSESQ